MFLLLYENLDKNQRDWLMRNALPVAPLAWIYNASVEGTLTVKLGSDGLKDLREKIEISATASIIMIEENIQKNSLRGSAKKMAVNKLNLIIESSVSLDIINHSKDLLSILGNSISPPSLPETIEKEENLGVDIENVRQYLARLAKDPSIH